MKFTATLEEKREIVAEYSSTKRRDGAHITAQFIGFNQVLDLRLDGIPEVGKELKAGKLYIITIEEIK